MKFCRIEVILIPQEAREKIAMNKKKKKKEILKELV